MKKQTLQIFTIAALSLASTAVGQTTLFNFDSVGVESTYCFDGLPEANSECIQGIVGNPSGFADSGNTSAMVFQVEYSGGGEGEYSGSGFELKVPTSTSLASNGSFFSILFRAASNPTGDIPIQFQVVKEDNYISAFNSYTATDGSWQKLVFDFSATGNSSLGEGSVFDEETVFTRVQVFPNNGVAPTAATFQMDDFIQYKANPLSIDSFNLPGEKASLFVKNSTKTLEVLEALGPLTIVDIAGRVVKTVDASQAKSISLASLGSGAFFVTNTAKTKTYRFSL